MNLSRQRATWLLFDAGWMFTKQAVPFLPYCQRIVTVGRLKWIEGSAFSSKDDCAWYLFDKVSSPHTMFFGKHTPQKLPEVDDNF